MEQGKVSFRRQLEIRFGSGLAAAVSVPVRDGFCGLVSVSLVDEEISKLIHVSYPRLQRQETSCWLRRRPASEAEITV